MNTSPDIRTAGLADRLVASRPVDLSAAGPEWLDAMRQDAQRHFLQSGLPGNRDEAWKYTSLRRLEQLAADMIPSGDLPADQAEAPIDPMWPMDAPGFSYRAGHWALRPQALPAGVSIQTLQESLQHADKAHARVLRDMLERVDVQGRQQAFAALNTAAMDIALVIRVAAGVDAGTCLAVWQTAGRAVAQMANVRVLLVLEPGARLRLLEQFQAEQFGDSAVAGQAMNLLWQAELGDGAELSHVRVQRDGAENVLLTFTDLAQQAGSQYRYAGFELSGGLVRHDISSRLLGPGAHADVSAAFVTDGERHVDHHVKIDHVSPGCSSEQFFRGVLGGHSRGVWNGKAIIRPGADGSSVRQSNANLLLSDLAEMDTKPELEIYADEVEASHGATVGQLDEKAVFYLRSRGLSEDLARRMLTAAFCHEVTGRLEDKQWAERIGQLLDEALQAMGLKAAGDL